MLHCRQENNKLELQRKTSPGLTSAHFLFSVSSLVCFADLVWRVTIFRYFTSALLTFEPLPCADRGISLTRLKEGIKLLQ